MEEMLQKQNQINISDFFFLNYKVVPFKLSTHGRTDTACKSQIFTHECFQIYFGNLI